MSYYLNLLQYFYLLDVLFRAILDKDCQPFLLMTVMVNLAFNSGSSKQGKAFLASVGWNCVVARYLSDKKFIYFKQKKIISKYGIVDPATP